MPLSDTAIRNAKPVDKPRKLADGGGLDFEEASASLGAQAFNSVVVERRGEG